MSEKGNDIKSPINKAIDASIDFEALMEKIDFNSWFEKIDKAETIKIDPREELVSKCDRQAFEQYIQWVKEAEAICKDFINPDYEKWIFDKNTDKEQFVRSLIHYLFKAKLNRLEARRTSTPDVERNKYIEGANMLNLALNHIPLEYLQKPLGDNKQRKKDYDLLMILFYNDLSICYAGLKNSSISRGYAEESIKLIEKDKDYIEFEKEIGNINGKIESKKATGNDYKKLSTLPFLSGEGRKYDLYTFALFCRGVAEFRSFLKEEAEKTFMQVINFVDKFKCNENSDYFSTLLNLALLFIDLGRGKEAIQLLGNPNEIDKKDEWRKDRRWAESILEKASALIDQSYYGEARKTLDELLDSEKSKNGARFTEPVLNGLIYYGRSYLEEARDILSEERIGGDTKKYKNLEDARKKLEEALSLSKEREQKSLVKKAAKHLAEVYQERKDTPNTLKYYSISISEGEVDDFKDLLKNKWDVFINQCEDIDILDNFSKQIFDFISAKVRRGKHEKEIKLCLDILDKLKIECEEKGNLVLAEQAERRKEEIELIQEGMEVGIPETLKGKNFEKNYKILTEEEFEDKQSKKKEKQLKNKQQKGNPLLLGKQIKARLDSNEETFDRALYGRTRKMENDSLVELIVLRRWNSFSPGLSRRYAISLGGGYLLRICAKEFKKINGEDLSNGRNNKSDTWFNIVIDPGYNFLLNFHSENFRIEDIDAIVVTHSHPDHCAELPGIMDLIRQINKRRNRSGRQENRKRVYLLVSEGAYKKFSSYIQDWQEQLKDVVLLRNETKWPKEEKAREFEIEAIRTAHADLGGVRAIGLLFKIKSENDILIGFIGDTPWRKDIKDSFKNCNLLCLHMGGIKPEEIGYKNDDKIDKKLLCMEIKKRLKNANHLLFYGSKDIIDSCQEEALVIVSEFGEELKYGLRTDLVNKLNFSTNPLCIPADIGLYLIITDKGDKKIRCDFCEKFVSPAEIKVFAYGVMDSLHYICDTCHCTLVESQKGTIVEHKLTRH